MEVAVASPSPPGSPTMDHFDFNGARISPYLSAPSSPKRFGEYYLSAPTSPSRFAEFYSEFEADGGNNDDGFAFFVSGESTKPSRSAEELFDGGKIKPLLKDDELFESARSPLLSPAQQQPKRSPIAQGKKVLREAFSPRKKKDSDAFASSGGRESEERRGRDRTPAAAVSSSSRRVTRSHSPYRVSHYTWEEEQHQHQQQQGSNKEDPNRASLSSTSSSSKSSRKWRLRDFLLFRSASEGRGSSKDPFRKYPVSFRKPEEGKASTSSFRNSEIPPKSRRKEPISAHELHYARKKAESEDLKKRTFLPYKQGILGRLAGFGSLTR